MPRRLGYLLPCWRGWKHCSSRYEEGTSTPESIDTQTINRRTNKQQEDKVQCTNMMTCQVYAMISSYNLANNLNGGPNN